MYDPSLGRWHVKDPLCEYHYNQTPYHYVLNNPLKYIDPFGLKEKDPDEEDPEENDNTKDGGTKLEDDPPTVYGKKPDSKNNSSFNWYDFLDISGNTSYRKYRPATWFEWWLLTNTDQSEARNFTNAWGAWGPLPMDQENFVTDPGITSDADIKKTKTGPSKETDSDARTANVEKNDVYTYEYKVENGHDYPVTMRNTTYNNGDTSLVTKFKNGKFETQRQYLGNGKVGQPYTDKHLDYDFFE